MALPALEVRDAAQIVGAVVTVTTLVLSQRWATKRLELRQDEERREVQTMRNEIAASQHETLRQLTALHKRIDSHADRIKDTEVEQAVMRERVSHVQRWLRDTQRFKLRPSPEEGAKT